MKLQRHKWVILHQRSSNRQGETWGEDTTWGERQVHAGFSKNNGKSYCSPAADLAAYHLGHGLWRSAHWAYWVTLKPLARDCCNLRQNLHYFSES